MKTLDSLIEEFQKIRTDAITEMFNNEDADGLYPTSKFFEKLDAAALKLYQSGLEAALECKPIISTFGTDVIETEIYLTLQLWEEKIREKLG